MSYYFMVDTYIRDNECGEYNAYITEVKPIVERFGGKYLVRTNTVESLNDARCPQRSIVIEFPDKKALESCFASEEYKAIMMKRVNCVDSRAIIVPGVEEETESERCQVMQCRMEHIEFDDEPASFERMDQFLEANKLERIESFHREIYLNNANRTEKSKLKTILRYTLK